MANGYMNGIGGQHSEAAAIEAPAKRKVVRKKPRQTAPEGHWWDLTPKGMAGLVLGIFGTLLAAGWLIPPAKQSDVDDLKESQDRIAVQLQALSGDIKTLKVSVDGYREQVIRIVTEAETKDRLAPIVVNQPQLRRLPVAKREDKPKKQEGIFSGILSGN